MVGVRGLDFEGVKPEEHSPRPRGSRTPDFSLGMDEIRAVAAFNVAATDTVISHFDQIRPEDERPRSAHAAARDFADGQPRSRQQRITAPAAHRAAKDVSPQAAFHAAMAAGDAAASVYLHPLANREQVGHILRGPTHAILALSLAEPADDAAGTEATKRIASLATPEVVEVLCRYPRTEPGTTEVSRLMHRLDSLLRDELRAVPGSKAGAQPRNEAEQL